MCAVPLRWDQTEVMQMDSEATFVCDNGVHGMKYHLRPEVFQSRPFGLHAFAHSSHAKQRDMLGKEFSQRH